MAEVIVVRLARAERLSLQPQLSPAISARDIAARVTFATYSAIGVNNFIRATS